MNIRLLLCIAMGVFVAHIGVVMLVMHLHPGPHPAPPLKPNFTTKTSVFVDPKTGEKTLYRELTVSTKFAPAPSTPPPAPPQIDTAAAR